MYNCHRTQAFVLAADYAYIRQLETTLKSIVFHNSHVKIYVFNQDIPREWFVHYRRLLQSIGSDLIDVKLLDVGLNINWTLNHNIGHINYMTFARYFIPQFVEEDVVLYLDVDIIVTTDLSNLFDTDISSHYLGASLAAFGHGIGFNAGVMLINNRRWKAENMTHLLVETTEREHDSVLEGDQTILNNLMGHCYLILDETYNYQIGYDHGAVHYGHLYLFERSLDPLPAILHYVSADKPWNTFSKGRLREVWWHYYLMEWSLILEKWKSLYRELPFIERRKALTLTHTYNVHHLELLARSCPDWEFHVAAFTNMGNALSQLGQYENIVLHPHILPPILTKWLADCDAYLDIDTGHKDKWFMNCVKQSEKPIFGFQSTQATDLTGCTNCYIYADDQPSDLIAGLSSLE